jgi:hypothetical protein
MASLGIEGIGQAIEADKCKAANVCNFFEAGLIGALRLSNI